MTRDDRPRDDAARFLKVQGAAPGSSPDRSPPVTSI